ncbi:two-component system, response regulator FlrC [Desulfocicer vacuolatum DSM 3385]|uniref:Two-component system, response regulator FlrC n=1 Tax=Desulfocicer vacuolatum DSM 3385 TaxID=1121400 RepID=A0A1W2BW05_9BACT|nr:sigma-54 dependent transcriptional regulator [Desulfocicer vacuolatum]SMC76924.1 two-component system, response regulator FlrC [Desulfocicer vacuolatum DSM 3385]
MAHILIVDDEDKIRHLLSMMLERRGHTTEMAANGQNAFEKLKSNKFDMIFSDIRMPEVDGKALILMMNNAKIYTPVVFITAFATVDSAVEMMRQGAADYITKPFDEEKIFITVERTLKLSSLIAENQAMRQQLQRADGKHTLVFKSQQMREIVSLAANVADSDTAVLITGESGTGKELIARYIHTKSKRKTRKFVPVNCAAISPNLVESELFGYEKGAFTGAGKTQIGKFEYADQGTLFLDEIGDLPLESQAKMLRALQEKKFQRVGGNEEIPVNVRIICATNKKLQQMVNRNKFRQDLLFRINVFPIEILPLRNRKDDILPLANHFLNFFKLKGKYELTKGAFQKLLEYPWPGNVRELGNAMERAIILTKNTGKITSETLSFLKIHHPEGLNDTIIKLPPNGIQLQTVQLSLVKQALTAAGNNQTSAAKLLGLSRAKFRVLLKNIEDDDKLEKEGCSP